MNTGLDSTAGADQPPEQKETQIHPRLQTQLEYTTESQSKSDVQVQPQLHPALESSLQGQVPDANASQQPEILQVAFQPVPNVRPEDVPLPDSPESQEHAIADELTRPFQEVDLGEATYPEAAVAPRKTQEFRITAYPSDAFQQADPSHAPTATTVPLDLQEPQPLQQVYIRQAPLAIPTPAPIPGIHNPPEQVAAIASNSATAAISAPAQPTDAVSELQERAKLAASRVRLMDSTIDILVETFKNKYQLDKELEKRCSKLLKATVVETTNKSLREDLDILDKSIQWTQEQLGYLEECLHEKHRNMQIAGPLVNAKKEHKKEEKQMKSIDKAARKIQQRAMDRDDAQIEKGQKESEARMIAEAWQQLSPS